MRSSTRVLLGAMLLASLVVVDSPLRAKSSEWKDAQGVAFKGEPVEVLGPFALLKAGAGGRRVLLRGLPPADCVRFYQESAARPPRVNDWAQAKGAISREFPGNVQRVEGDRLVPASLAGRPEPEIFIILYASHNEGEGWFMLRNFHPTYRRIQQVYPGRCEALLYGLRHDAAQHKNLAVGSYLPWLVTDLNAQSSMGPIARFAPGEGGLLLAISRDGVPLASSRGRNLSEVKHFVDELTELLRITDPENPATWRDRLQYLNAVRPVQFAGGQSGPVLVGNPLRADGLRQRGVTRVAAQLDVAADGKVTAAHIAPGTGVPDALIPALAGALQQGASFSPAVEQGRPVAGKFDYVFEFPAQDPRPAADVAWLRGDARLEVAMTNWLVLKPIDVPPSVFSTIDRVDESGVHVMTEYTASSEKVTKASQINSFTSDWFSATGGAASVRAVAGDKVTVDEKELGWRAVSASDGYVDLQTFERRDYCIGYAATEIELPQDVDGWLAIGSDDGLRIWLNGELVHDRWIRRISQVDDDIVPLKLKAGRNRLLIKIQNVTGDWSFVSRLRLRAP